MINKIDARIVLFYTVAIILVGSLIFISFQEDIESFLDKTSLSWLQMRGLKMTEEEYAESESHS